ncbi:MAG: uroporphyrinogen-III synthase [Rubricoccaceae bacterium]
MTEPAVPMLPLRGRLIVVTRAADQAEALAGPLRALGAAVALVPAIRSEPAEAEALAAAARALGRARWLGFTSPSGVRYGWPAVAAAWPDGLPGALGVAAVGPGTAEALRARGVVPAFQPREASGDAFAAELPVAPGDRVVLMRSHIARRAVAEALRARGAVVTDAVAYRTVEGARPEAVHAALEAQPDAVTFTAPSAVRGFLAGLDAAGLDAAGLDAAGLDAAGLDAAGLDAAGRARLRSTALVPIGSVTAAALTEAGLTPALIPSPSTLPGLVAALRALFADA